MLVQTSDFDGAGALVAAAYGVAWQELDAVLQAMPLHLKESDQLGRQGKLVFDPKGANDYIRTHLLAKGWKPNIPIHEDYSFMGLDIDFGKDGIVGDPSNPYQPLPFRSLDLTCPPCRAPRSRPAPCSCPAPEFAAASDRSVSGPRKRPRRSRQ